MFAAGRLNEYYKSEEEYYFAVADALHDEYQEIVDAGYNIQIDDVSLPGRYRLQAASEGVDAFQNWAALAVDALNRALRRCRPRKLRYHLCWSSQEIYPYRRCARSTSLPALLKMNVQGYQIEAANVQHGHDWSIWSTAEASRQQNSHAERYLSRNERDRASQVFQVVE